MLDLWPASPSSHNRSSAWMVTAVMTDGCGRIAEGQRQAARASGRAFKCIVAFENEPSMAIADAVAATRHHHAPMLIIVLTAASSLALRPIAPIRFSTPRMAAGDNVDAARERVLDDFDALAQTKVIKTKGGSTGSSFAQSAFVGASAVAAIIGARAALEGSRLEREREQLEQAASSPSRRGFIGSAVTGLAGAALGAFFGNANGGGEVATTDPALIAKLQRSEEAHVPSRRALPPDTGRRSRRHRRHHHRRRRPSRRPQNKEAAKTESRRRRPLGLVAAASPSRSCSLQRRDRYGKGTQYDSGEGRLPPLPYPTPSPPPPPLPMPLRTRALPPMPLLPPPPPKPLPPPMRPSPSCRPPMPCRGSDCY